MPTIDDVVQYQRRLNQTSHLVYMGATGFVLAHTDAERATGRSLECAIHRALANLRYAPVTTERYYTVKFDGGELRFLSPIEGAGE